MPGNSFEQKGAWLPGKNINNRLAEKLTEESAIEYPSRKKEFTFSIPKRVRRSVIVNFVDDNNLLIVVFDAGIAKIFLAMRASEG